MAPEATDAWYPSAAAYWAPDPERYPDRYGDIFTTPELGELRSKNKPWHAVAVLHPSCELNDKARDDTQVVVARVVPVTAHGKNQRPAIRTGWSEQGGHLHVALAHTFWIPPLPGEPAGPDDDAYIDFRRTQRVPLAALRTAGRRASMTHDARVALIRRDLYFRYRWIVSIDQVRHLEAVRIRGDQVFQGPRPPWA